MCTLQWDVLRCAAPRWGEARCAVLRCTMRQWKALRAGPALRWVAWGRGILPSRLSPGAILAIQHTHPAHTRSS